MSRRPLHGRDLWWFSAALGLALVSAPWQPSQADGVDEAMAARAMLEWLESDEPETDQAAAAATAAEPSASRAGGSRTVMQVP